MVLPESTDPREILVLSLEEGAAERKAVQKEAAIRKREEKYNANAQKSKDRSCLQCRVKSVRCPFTSNERASEAYKEQCYVTRFYPTISVTQPDELARCCGRCAKHREEFCLIPGAAKPDWGTHRVEQNWWARGIATDVAMARANELLAKEKESMKFVPSKPEKVQVPKNVWKESRGLDKEWWKWKSGIKWVWNRDAGGEFFLRDQEN